jgi:GntR family transcriptional regulator
MEFNDNKSIYLQLADLLCEQILVGKWPPQEKIPSVRDMGMMVQVNPNTVLRTYDLLQQKGIIFNKRGIGYFTDDNAIQKILQLRKDDFFTNTLPKFFKTITLLGISLEDISNRYSLFKETTTSEEK